LFRRRLFNIGKWTVRAIITDIAAIRGLVVLVQYVQRTIIIIIIFIIIVFFIFEREFKGIV